jgi:hypothetical protein
MYQLKRVQCTKMEKGRTGSFFASPKQLLTIKNNYSGIERMRELPDNLSLDTVPLSKDSFPTKMKRNTVFTPNSQPEFTLEEQHFAASAGAVQMIAIAQHQAPFGTLDRMMHPLAVVPKRNQRVEYRFKKTEELFV